MEVRTLLAGNSRKMDITFTIRPKRLVWRVKRSDLIWVNGLNSNLRVHFNLLHMRSLEQLSAPQGKHLLLPYPFYSVVFSHLALLWQVNRQKFPTISFLSPYPSFVVRHSWHLVRKMAAEGSGESSRVQRTKLYVSLSLLILYALTQVLQPLCDSMSVPVTGIIITI